MAITIDVFPISFDYERYPLIAYGLKGTGSTQSGGRLAYRVRKRLKIPCIWLKNPNRLIATPQLTLEMLTSLLEELWQSLPDDFGQITGVYADSKWQSSEYAIAQFIAQGVLSDTDQVLRTSLQKEKKTVGTVLIERVAEPKGLVVQGTPSLQIVISSRLTSQQSLKEFYATRCDSPEDLKGMMVADKTSATMKGVIESIVEGSLGEHRKRLMLRTSRDIMLDLLEKAPDNDLVLSVKTKSGQQLYDYCISTLDIVVRMGDLKDMGVDSKDVSNKLKITPADRRHIISIVQGELEKFTRSRKGITLGDSYNSKDDPQLFMTAEDIGFTTELRFGKGSANINNDGDMLSALRQLGLYRKAPDFEKSNVVRIAVLDALPGVSDEHHYGRLHKHLAELLGQVELKPERAIEPAKLTPTTSPTAQRAQMEELLDKLITAKPHIILVYLPQSDRQNEEDDTTSLYHRAKAICVSRGIPSQVVYEDTLTNQYADANILMGILAKIGNIPFVLAKPLDYTDLIVGLDVSRRANIRTAGTKSIPAMSRIYVNSGEFIGYTIGMPIEGEAIPRHVLERILPYSEFSGKKVIIHRDGYLAKEELDSLMEWAEHISATFYPIEVIKSGASRLYTEAANTISQPQKGNAFIVDENSAYLATSILPSPKKGDVMGTIDPLHIHNRSKLSLKQALHSVLALTMLHYGSLRPTKLPVSTDSSDEIAGFLTRGIQPDRETGKIPFWL